MVFSEEMHGIARGVYGVPRTRRAEQDFLYRMKACGVIREVLDRRPDSPLRTLFDPDKFTAGEPTAWRPMILTELGRALRDLSPEDWNWLAHQAAQTNASTKVAVKNLRFARRNGVEALRDRFFAARSPAV